MFFSFFTFCEKKIFCKRDKNMRKVVVRPFHRWDHTDNLTVREFNISFFSPLRRSDKVQSGELEYSLLQQTAGIFTRRYAGCRVSEIFIGCCLRRRLVKRFWIDSDHQQPILKRLNDWTMFSWTNYTEEAPLRTYVVCSSLFTFSLLNRRAR